MRSADTPRTRGTHPTPRPFGTSHEIEPKPVTLREGPHLTSQPPYPSPQLAELDARVRALDHLHQLAALAATGAGDGEFPAPRTRKPDRPGNRDAARSDASDHAATERCATRLRQVSASLSAIATTTTDADTTNAAMDPRRACAALAASLASRLAALGSDRTEQASRARAVAEDALGTAGDWINLESIAVGSIRSPERSSQQEASRSPRYREGGVRGSKLTRSSTPNVRRLVIKGDGTVKGSAASGPVGSIGCEALTHGASWFAGAYGAWAASHAKMGRELRDGKPASVPPARDGKDGTSSGDGTYRIGGMSPWAESAVKAIDSVAAAASALGPQSPLGTDALFLLVELLDRTSGVVANWVTHQPRLWPGSRTVRLFFYFRMGN